MTREDQDQKKIIDESRIGDKKSADKYEQGSQNKNGKGETVNRTGPKGFPT